MSIYLDCKVQPDRRLVYIERISVVHLMYTQRSKACPSSPRPADRFSRPSPAWPIAIRFCRSGLSGNAGRWASNSRRRPTCGACAATCRPRESTSSGLPSGPSSWPSGCGKGWPPEKNPRPAKAICCSTKTSSCTPSTSSYRTVHLFNSDSCIL